MATYNLFVLSVQYQINWIPFVYKLYSSTSVKLQKTSRLHSVFSILVFIHFETDVGVDESRVPVLILIQDTGYDLLVPAGILFI